MHLIARGETKSLKSKLPPIWCCFFAAMAIMELLSSSIDWLMFIFLIGLGFFGIIVFKRKLLKLVDEVYDCGDHLLIRNGAEEDRIPLKNILLISNYEGISDRMPVVTLFLSRASKFGEKVMFSPEKSLIHQKEDWSITNFLERIEKAKKN
jgi:hypothetical protein